MRCTYEGLKIQAAAKATLSAILEGVLSETIPADVESEKDCGQSAASIEMSCLPTAG